MAIYTVTIPEPSAARLKAHVDIVITCCESFGASGFQHTKQLDPNCTWFDFEIPDLYRLDPDELDAPYFQVFVVFQNKTKTRKEAVYLNPQVEKKLS